MYKKKLRSFKSFFVKIHSFLISIEKFYSKKNKAKKILSFFCIFVVSEFVKTCDELVKDEEDEEMEEVEFVEVKEEIILIKNQFDKLLTALDFDVPQISDKVSIEKT